MYTYDLLSGSLLSVFLPKSLLQLLPSSLIYNYHIRLILESCSDLPTMLVCHCLVVCTAVECLLLCMFLLWHPGTYVNVPLLALAFGVLLTNKSM